MTDAVIYIRFSTKRQEKGFSKERQLEECQAFCKRKGWNVIQIVEDLGQSAWKGHHLSVGNLGKWRRSVDAGDVPLGTILVVHKLDRLSRLEPRVTQRWMEDLCDKGIKIATVDGDRVFDDAYLKGPMALMGIMEIVMHATVNHAESEKKSQLVADAWRRKQQLTRQTDGDVPHDRLAQLQEFEFGHFSERVKEENYKWLIEEEERLGRYARDMEIEIEAQIVALDVELKELQRQKLSPHLSMEEKVSVMRDIRRKETARDELKMSQFDTKKQVSKDINDKLDEFSALLDQQPRLEEMFTLRWTVA